MTTTSSPAARPAEAIVTADASPTAMFFGLAAPTVAPTASDLPAPKPAMPSIHFGRGEVSPGAGRPRNFRTATTRRKTPSASSSADAPWERVESFERPMVSARTVRTDMTAATPTTNPAR